MHRRLCFALLLLSAALFGEKHSTTVKTKIKAAAAADQAGDLVEARRLLTEARTEEPQSIDVLAALARLARQECRWDDGLLLLKEAQALSPRQRLSPAAQHEVYFMDTSRLHAPPGIYCGPTSRMTPPMPLQRVPIRGACETEPVSLWVLISPEGVVEQLVPLPDGSSGHCADVATKTVSQWRFQPIVANGRRVRVAFTLSLHR